MRSLLMRDTIFLCEIDQGQSQPTGKMDVGAELIDVTLAENDSDLDPTLPTPFFDVKDTRVDGRSLLYCLRSHKQGYAELGGSWCMLNGHGR